MISLTFGEQVKIVLKRRNMTIKELAEIMEQRTGRKMSRQNLTQRLGRDNFQEQDMRIVADILGCSFQLNILNEDEVIEKSVVTVQPKQKKKELPVSEREVTIGELAELYDSHTRNTTDEKNQLSSDQLDVETAQQSLVEGIPKVIEEPQIIEQPIVEITAEQELDFEQVEEIKQQIGEVNPYTGKEYESNSVRMHGKRIGYVQVYDKNEHKWTDMTEWAFLGYQERKKALLGKAYKPPIYLD